MTTTDVSVSPAWLALREPADARSRASDLVLTLTTLLDGVKPLVIHDLGSGTGSMARWLAPRLPGPQLWVMHDCDPVLLKHAGASLPPTAVDGSPVAVQLKQRDIGQFDDEELVGASLVTASALLDILTAEELEHIVDRCMHARCAALLTLSVTGHVELTPADPLDGEVGAAFNAHQRRVAGRARLLGPDAAGMAAALFARFGAQVVVRPSPWHLGRAETGLIVDWFTGWVGAACEQRPELMPLVGNYVRRRLAEAAEGRLRVTVQHEDVLAWPAR